MPQPDVIRLDLPATYKYLNVLGTCLAEIIARVEGLRDPATVTYNVQLAVHEACTNIINHAYCGQASGRIWLEVTLSHAQRYLLVELHDTGKEFDLTQVPSISLDEVHVHGYGLFLMQELMDEVSYEPKTGNNCWRLIKYL